MLRSNICGVGYGSLWVAFYIKTKDDCCIMFPICNSLTRTESAVRIPLIFLTQNFKLLKRK
ncbi:hypothetical protein B0192_09800 [Leptospira interrogans serovar Australis]|nr:hypothetical protein B0192_09800 [Leptospira interrogans serovar Australis]